jgi:hypothetical protein
MKMPSVKGFGLGLALALVSSVPALAGVLTVNYSGYLTRTKACHTCDLASTPYTNYAEGAVAWSGSFTLDASNGTTFVGSYYTNIQGGQAYPTSTNWGSQVITDLHTSTGPLNFGMSDSLGHDTTLYTISNVTATDRQFYLYYVTKDDDLYTTWTFPLVHPVGFQDSLILNVINPGIAYDMNGTFSLFDPAGLGTISFSNESYDPGGCTYCWDYFFYDGKITAITVTDAATNIPEPLTLSSFAVGLAGTAAIRRRSVRKRGHSV